MKNYIHFQSFVIVALIYCLHQFYFPIYSASRISFDLINSSTHILKEGIACPDNFLKNQDIKCDFHRTAGMEYINDHCLSYSEMEVLAITMTCPSNVTVQCDNQVPPPNPASVTATSTCAGAVTVALLSDVVTNQVCANRYLLMRTYQATDLCGSSAVCTQQITVFDNTAPAITCPPNFTVNCSNQVPTPNITTVTAIENCSGASIITYLGDIIVNGICPNRFTIVRKYSATDFCGNSSTCIQLITVSDNTGPTITCPPNITVNCANMVPPPNPASVTALDNCSGTPIVSHLGDVVSNQTCANRFTLTRTYAASDGCGNSASCVQLITVFDNTSPVITCPPNLTLNCNQSTLPASSGMASAIDNCGGSTTITFSDVINQGICTNNAIVMRKFTATDVCGNTAICVQTITVSDNTPPAITCPPNISLSCNQSTLPAFTGSASATDNCNGSVTISFSDVFNVGICTNSFAVMRTFTAIDVCGNAAVCIQIITVTDNMPPVITCPPNVTLNCNQSTLPSFTGTASATDNCGGAVNITFSDVINQGICINNFNVVRTFTAKDACNNSSVCTQTITVSDNTPPVITCPPNVTLNCNQNTLPLTAGTATAIDNCAGSIIISFADVINQGICPNNYTIIRTFTATDDCGNAAICTQTISISDNTPPVITCPPAITLNCGQSTLPSSTGLATAIDNCAGPPTITFSDLVNQAICPVHFIIIRTFTATDLCAHSSVCTQTISIVDNNGPSVTCPPDLTVNCASLVPLPDPASVTSTDICSGSTTVNHLGDVISNQTCPGNFIISRTYMSIDECGNAGSCVQTITVLDNTPPAIICPSDITINCSTQIPPPDPATVTALDNCNGSTVINHLGDIFVNQTCAYGYIIMRTYVAVDACGNTATCVQAISIIDNIAPVITCPFDLSLSCTDSTLPSATGIATAIDNCSSTPIITHSDVIFPSTPSNFIIQRTWTAIDDCGNSSTCYQTLLVEDNVPPLLSNCPSDMSLSFTGIPSPCSQFIQIGLPSATDLCDQNVSVVNNYNFTSDASDFYPDGSTQVIFTATDDGGNTSTCSFTITVSCTTVGIFQPFDSLNIRLYPNPNTGEFIVELTEPARSKMTLQIVGTTGQIVFESKAEIGNRIQTIQAPYLPQGMYFIQILSEGRVMSTNKFVKQ